MKIVITGSSGQLGSYLVEHFSGDNEVVGLDIRECPYPEIAPLTTMADVVDHAALGELIRGADWVIHTAAQVSVERSVADPLYDARNNVLGTVNLLWNAFKYDVQKFMYISSAAVFGNPVRVPIDENHPTDPMSPYGASKLCGEKYVRSFSIAYGMSSVIIRPFNIYSPRADPDSPYSGVITRFIQRAKNGEPLVIEGDGSQTRDFVHVSDVVRMVEMGIKKSASIGGTFNCGTGIGSSISELADRIISLSGGDVPVEYAPPRMGDIRHSRADIGLAERLLGYFPKKDLSEGLKELLSSE